MRTITVLNECTLASGVIVDIIDKGGDSSRTVQVGFKTFEQVSFVVDWAHRAVIGRGKAKRTVECVIGCATGIRLIFQRNLCRPVRSALVVYNEFAATVQEVTFEIVLFAGVHTQAVEALIRFSSQVSLFWIGLRLAVNGTIYQRLGSIVCG